MAATVLNAQRSDAEHAVVASSGPRPPRKAARPALVSTLTFERCDPVPLNYEQYVHHRERKRRFELWDRDTQTAWELRDRSTGLHARPIQVLGAMMTLMGAVRGVDVFCSGDRGLALLDDDGRRRVLHPDQAVYLTRPTFYDGEGDIPVNESGMPSVVMEVDNTTDTRKGKLALYEDMGVPELWIEVPELWREWPGAKLPVRPAGLVPGLTIFLLEGGEYRESPTSRAMLGWPADDIHEALNKLPGLTVRHYAVIEELGRRFGAHKGTGPDDHPLMRSMRRESRDEGIAQGMLEGKAKLVRGMIERRGIAVSTPFPLDIPRFAEAPVEELLDAAAACGSEQDFRSRLRNR